MQRTNEFYINGQWVTPSGTANLDVINPATEESITSIPLGDVRDVDKAVQAARHAFDSYSQTSREERLELLDSIIAAYKTRTDDLAEAVRLEMGAPITLASKAQVPSGLGHFITVRSVLADFAFESETGTTLVIKEPVGVCGLITPWNWPLNQICTKVAPALAAGCTMVLKPSEIAPLSALIFAEILDEASVPAGVFNLINGDGPIVGTALSSHPEVDMMSFTGSTRAGVEVARNAAPTVKRVAQELGGKSANIILDDVDLEAVISRDVMRACGNSGQSCNAGTRILVPNDRMDEAAGFARETSERVMVGDPTSEETAIGPVASGLQFEKIQGLIEAGIAEGAKLEAGGLGRPDGLDKGFYIKPTVFSHVTNDMTIAQQEIFGPVVVIIGYKDDDDAVRIANDTVYGLSGYVSSADPDRARDVARRIRTGMVHVNGAPLNNNAPFGGYKQSGNGREWGEIGLEEFLEIKSIFGAVART